MATDKYIYVIVDGEVAVSIPIPAIIGESGQERMIAAFQSNPQFVISEDRIQYLSRWDGEKFTPPA